MATKIQQLNVGDATIKLDGENEMVSLTDLWRALGGDPIKSPKHWLKNQPSQDFLVSLAVDLKVLPSTLTTIRRGKHGGTWGHWQVALAYTKWVDPTFHVHVNNAYREWVEEVRDPGLKLDRAVAAYRRRGKSDAWISQRFRGVKARNELTSACHEHNCTQRAYPIATTSVSLAATGKTPKALRAEFGLKATATPRDHLDAGSLLRTELIESESARQIRLNAADGDEECLDHVRRTCAVLKAAFAALDAA